MKPEQRSMSRSDMVNIEVVGKMEASCNCKTDFPLYRRKEKARCSHREIAKTWKIKDNDRTLSKVNFEPPLRPVAACNCLLICQLSSASKALGWASSRHLELWPCTHCVVSTVLVWTMGITELKEDENPTDDPIDDPIDDRSDSKSSEVMTCGVRDLVRIQWFNR